MSDVPVEFSWENVSSYWFGNVPIGLTEITASESAPAEAKFALGKKAIAIGNAQSKFAGTMKMLGSQYAILMASLPPGKRLTQVAPNTLVVVLGPNDEGQIETTKIIGLKVTKTDGGWKVGDTHREVSIEYICVDIQGSALC